MELTCFECGERAEGDTVGVLAERFLAHARAAHEWPFPDQAIRNYAEATQRLTGPAERLDAVGVIEVHPVTEDRLDDWAEFFDHDAFVGTPEWAACYCLEPHVRLPDGTDEDVAHWSANRQAMLQRLRAGEAFGYLAYVDGRPAGWVNASKRSDYTLFGDPPLDPPAGHTVGVACFVIAPPYRRHGLAGALLDRVIADASGRGARWVEAYPFNDDAGVEGAKNFRGPRPLYDARGFEEVERRERYSVVRRQV